MPQVYANAIPHVRRAAHAVYQHIVWRQQPCGFGMLLLPAFEPGFSSGPVGALRDDKKRHLRYTPGSLWLDRCRLGRCIHRCFLLLRLPAKSMRAETLLHLVRKFLRARWSDTLRF